jgi:hypothetical protein
MHDPIINETKIVNIGVLLNKEVIKQYNNIKEAYYGRQQNFKIC